MFINPIVTFLGIFALYVQWQKAFALSIFGLASQVIVFALVALSWIFRVSFLAIPISKISLSILNTWYQLVGWAAVNNAIFAIVQFVLLCVVKHYRREGVDSTRPDEEPLLVS
jgi:hydrogenase-4 membrane subunit HyfE